MIYVLKKFEERFGFGKPEVVSNRMAILFAVLVALGALLDFSLGDSNARVGVELGIAVMLALVPALNNAGYFRWTRYYHLAAANIFILVFCAFCGPENHFQLLFIGMGVLPLLMKTPGLEDRLFVNFGVSLAACCYFFDETGLVRFGIKGTEAVPVLVNYYVMLLAFLSPLVAVVYFQSNFLETHARLRKTTQELFDSHEQLEFALNAAGLAPWQIDTESNLVLSPQFLRMFGLPADSGSSSPEKLAHLIHQNDRELVVSSFEQARKQGGSFDLRYRFWVDKTKEPIWVWSRGRAAIDPATGKMRLIGISGDVTASKKAEIEIQKSRDEFKLMADMITPLIWVCRANGSCEFASSRLASYVGVEPEALEEDGWKSIIHPEDFEKHTNAIGQAFTTGQDCDIESRLRRHDGVYRWHLSNARCMRDENGKIVKWYGTSTDIEARKVLDAQIEADRAKMVASSKMTALGEVASGIAHEINNPLSVIKGRSEQLVELASSGLPVEAGEVARIAGIVNTTTTRIAKIIRSLKYFARNADTDEKQLVSVKSILDEAFELCREKFRFEGVELTIHEAELDLKVYCRNIQLYQAIVNLLSNAYDAVQNQPVKRVEVSLSAKGGEVEIRVGDSGTGVPDAVVDRLFEPFFTTKEPGKGTGLGLSISKKLMESNGGTLVLENSPSGATFAIRLPSAPQETELLQPAARRLTAAS